MSKFQLWQVAQLADGSFAAYRELEPYFFVTAKTAEEANKKAALAIEGYSKVTGKSVLKDYGNIVSLDERKVG